MQPEISEMARRILEHEDPSLKAHCRKYLHTARHHHALRQVCFVVDAAIAQAALYRDLGRFTGAPGEAQQLELMRSAILGAIILYFRSFGSNHGHSSLDVASLDIPETHRETHDLIKNIRDKAIAHIEPEAEVTEIESINLTAIQSDSGGIEVNYFWGNNLSILTAEELKSFRELIGVIHDDVLQPKLEELGRKISSKAAKLGVAQ